MTYFNMVGFTTNTSAFLASDITVNDKGVITHDANVSTQANVVNIAANNITINSGGSINVDEKGYVGSASVGYGPGGASGGGGGHGGAGGGAGGGVAYCSPYNPNTIGSAGSRHSYYGTTPGAGGGLILLAV